MTLQSRVRRTRNSVEAISLDEVLSRFQRARLMKIDCEGSEFPILLTSKLLTRVDRIVGEYHEIPSERMLMLAAEARVDGVESIRRNPWRRVCNRRDTRSSSCP